MLSPAGPLAPEHQPPEEPAQVCEDCGAPWTLADYGHACEVCGGQWAVSQENWEAIAENGRQIDELYGPLTDTNFGPSAATSIERETTTWIL